MPTPPRPARDMNTPKTKQHTKPVDCVNWFERLSFLGSWLLVSASLFVCGMGVLALVHTLKRQPIAQVEVMGDLTGFEQHLLYDTLQPLVKHGYFQADLEPLQQAAAAISWVDHVRITRHWPNKIIVRAVAKHAIARWGGVRLLNNDGLVFSESTFRDHRDLPIMHGPTTQSLALMRLYQNINKWFSPLGLHVQEIYFTDRLTCFMQFDNGLRIIVDQDRTLEKLQQLGQLAVGEMNPVFKHLASIDLRYRNGFAVQWKNAQRPKIVAGRLVDATL